MAGQQVRHASPARSDSSPSPFANAFGVIRAQVGPFLADGQRIQYSFNLANPFFEPLANLHVEAMSPCCSSVLQYPEAVGPREKFEIKIEYRSGTESIRRGLAFVLYGRQSNGTKVQLPLAVIVHTLAACEFLPIDSEAGTALADGSHHWQFRLITRHKRLEDAYPEPQIRVSSGLSARILELEGKPLRRNGFVEVSRRIDVVAAPEQSHGPRQGSLEVVLPNLSWSHTLKWITRAPIEIQPEALIIQDGTEIHHNVILTSINETFRLLGIECPWAVVPKTSLPSNASTRHEFHINIPSRKVQGDRAVDLRIQTDMAGQPEVVITLMDLRRHEEMAE